MLPAPPERDERSGGRPRIPDQLVFERYVLFLRAGCSWETFDELSKGSGCSGRVVRDRLKEWRQLELFERLEAELRAEIPVGDVAHLDAVFIRSRGGGEEGVGLTRHGKGSKLQALCNEESLPVAWQLYSANPNEKRLALETLSRLDDPELLGGLLVVGDKAYDFDDLRDDVEELGALLLSPHRSDRKKPPRAQEEIGRHYSARWRVERFFAWLSAWRRVATRWERKLSNYRSGLCLALSLIYTRGGFCQML